MALHDVAVCAAGGVVLEIRTAFAVSKGEDSESQEDAERRCHYDRPQGPATIEAIGHRLLGISRCYTLRLSKVQGKASRESLRLIEERGALPQATLASRSAFSEDRTP